MSAQRKHSVHVQILHDNIPVFDKVFDSFPVTIGRSAKCDICLDKYNWVSSEHASILPIDGKLFLVDMGSTNGFTHKGRKVKQQELSNQLDVEIRELVIKISAKDIDQSEEDELTVYDSEDLEVTASDFTELELGTPVVHQAEGQVASARIPQAPKTPKASEPSVKMVSDHSAKNVFDKPMPAPQEMNRGFMQRVPANKLALESCLMWKGEILEKHVHYKGEGVTLTSRPEKGLHLPLISSDVPIAFFTGSKTKLNLPNTCSGTLTDLRNQSKTDIHDLMEYSSSQKVSKVSFVEDQELDIYIGSDVYLKLRHIEAPEPFSQVKFLLPEKLFKKALTGSGFIHILMLIVGLMAIPTVEAPKVNNLPPRIARLLVKKPKPKKIVKKPKPKPKKIVKKKTPPKKKLVAKKVPKKIVKPKKIYKPKKVVIKPTKRMKKVNKYPFTVKTSKIAKKPIRGFTPKKKTNVKTVGALAALGALGKSAPNPSNKPVAININPNAGGSPGKFKANAVIGALRTKSGKLAAGGSGSLKTTGKGFGTGTGYGVQGIKGRSGGRGVSATVVGSPTLMKISRSEGLTNKQVMTVVKKHAGKISSCYERALLNNPGLSGRVEYEWKILPRGSVTWAKVKKSNIQRSSELNNCVVGVFKAMKFPKAKNGFTTIPNIGFPFGRL